MICWDILQTLVKQFVRFQPEGIIILFYNYIFKIFLSLFVDLLKVIQLALVLILWLRILAHFSMRLFTYEEETQIYLIVIDNFFYIRMVFISISQFSFYILIKHINTYKMMINGKSYSEWKALIQKAEKLGISIIISVNILIDLLTAALEAYGYYLDSDWMFIIDDIIFIVFSWVLIFTEYHLHQKLKSTMSRSLNYHYQKHKKFIHYSTNFNFLFLIEMIIWMFVEMSLALACGTKNYNGWNKLTYDWIHITALMLDCISNILYK